MTLTAIGALIVAIGSRLRVWALREELRALDERVKILEGRGEP